MLWKCLKLLFFFEIHSFFLIYILHLFVHTTSKCACTCSVFFALKSVLRSFFTGLLTTRGSVSDKPLSTWKHLSEKGDLTRRTAEEQPYTEEEITPQEGGTTGDQHTASGAAIALQGDVERETSVVMEKTSEPGAVVV